jgi:hypothetical protein
MITTLSEGGTRGLEERGIKTLWTNTPRSSSLDKYRSGSICPKCFDLPIHDELDLPLHDDELDLHIHDDGEDIVEISIQIIIISD